MTINELVYTSKRDEKKIREEHRILDEFQRQHPWLIQGVLSELKLKQDVKGESIPLPKFESILTFKENFLVNSMGKIYKQISELEPKTVNCPVYFYKVLPNFYEIQKEKGLGLGEMDDFGYMVTGSNLVIETRIINREEFLGIYYGTHN